MTIQSSNLAPNTATQDILFEEHNHVGWITLNRPKALNALTHEMIKQLDAQLLTWETDPSINAVIIKSNSEKAFCAGGDVRSVYNAKLAGDMAPTQHFFRDEYRMNWRIHRYPKPFVALMNGVVMGGGMGISIHGSHRIVTDNTMLAMPETSIGFFPDIGGTYFLSRCPGKTGLYLGLTGARLNFTDAVYSKLATHYVPQNFLSKLEQEIREIDWVHYKVYMTKPKWVSSQSVSAQGVNHKIIDTVVEKYHAPVGVGPLRRREEQINAMFNADSVQSIIANLTKDDDQWSHETAATLAEKSPTSLVVTLKAIRNATIFKLDATLNMEYRLSQAFMNGYDFFEGVRALLVDKDKQPKWSPESLDAAAQGYADSYFEFNPGIQLNLQEI